MATDANGYPLCQIKSTTWQTAVTSSTQIAVGSWAHIVCTYDLISLKIYINGELKGTQALTAVADDTAALTKIGKDDSASTTYGMYTGIADEYKFFNYPLTADDVKNEYNGNASAMIGSSGSISGTGAPTNAASGEYCVPGDTTACAAPVGEWKMDEQVSGDAKTIYDTSGSGNNGTTEQGGNGTGMNCSVSGKFGTGCQFDGLDDYVNLPLMASQLDGTGSFTVSAWVNPPTLPFSGYPGIFSRGTTNQRVPWIFGNSGSSGINAQFETTTGGAADCNVYSSNLTAGVWQYIVLTWDGNNCTLYRNAVSGTSDATTGHVLANIDSAAYIGRLDEPYYWSGKIDQVRIYNYARTPAQIAWEYNKGKPIAEWRMNECQGGTIHDESGNNNSGTINVGSSGSQTTTLGNGTCITAGTTPWYGGRSGKYGASLNFDGTDDYVNVEKSMAFDNEISMSAWVYLRSYATNANSPDWGQRTIVDSNDSGNSYGDDQMHGIAVQGVSSGQASAIINWDVNVYAANRARALGNVVPLNQWHLITMTADGFNLKLYQNGVFITQTAYTNIGLYDPVRFNLGRFANTGLAGYFDGLIDDVKIFNYALTAEQVKTLYNASSVVNFGN